LKYFYQLYDISASIMQSITNRVKMITCEMNKAEKDPPPAD